MNKIKVGIILVLVLAAFGLGVYFKDDVLRLYQSANQKIQDFKKTDIGSVISQVGKELITPPPLLISGQNQASVLLKTKIIDETNDRRRENGLPPLDENSILDKAAAGKANDMFKNQYFEHKSPSGVGPGDLVQSFGYSYILAGENLILGNFKDEREIVEDWMNSPGHRANILNDRFTEIGVAIIKGTYEGDTVWIGVQEFGLPSSTCQDPDASLKAKIDSNKAELDSVSRQIDSKKTYINSMNPKSPGYKNLVDSFNALVEDYNKLAAETKQMVNQYNEQANQYNSCVSGK